MNSLHVALLVGAGFLAGICNAIAGGGSLLTFPALLATGLPPVTANVTNTVAVWPGYLGGTTAFRDRLREKRGLLTRLLVAGSIGGVVGSVLLLRLPPSIFHSVVPFLVLGATTLFAVQPVLTKLIVRWARRAERDASGVPLMIGIFLAGLYGAYFTGGLGIILLVTLMLCVEAEIQYLSGVKTVLQLAVSTIALVGFALFGPVDWIAALVVAPACLVGGIAGGRISRRLHPVALRVLVTVFGLVIGVKMLL
jgi:uncharacterized membrane protein YfcA